MDYIRDVIEPPMSEDMSIYFPEVVQQQFGFSTGLAYGPRDQEPNYLGKERINKTQGTKYIKATLTCHLVQKVS